jgi:hypothetical protein
VVCSVRSNCEPDVSSYAAHCAPVFHPLGDRITFAARLGECVPRLGDGSTTADSRLVCYITATGNGPSGEAGGELAASYVGGLIDTLRRALAAGDLVASTAEQVRSEGLSLATVSEEPPVLRTAVLEAAPVTARYAVSLTEA